MQCMWLGTFWAEWLTCLVEVPCLGCKCLTFVLFPYISFYWYNLALQIYPCYSCYYQPKQKLSTWRQVKASELVGERNSKLSCSIKPSTNALTESKQQLKSMKSGLYLQRGTKEILHTVFGLKGYSPQNRNKMYSLKAYSFQLRKEFKLHCHWVKSYYLTPGGKGIKSLCPRKLT